MRLTTAQAAVLSVAATAFAREQPKLAANGETFPITGVAMQMTQLDGRYFEHAGSDMMQGQQMFSGWVARDGVRYYGTLTLFMEFTGNLSEPPGVDCFNEPQNLACGAADFSGTWKVLAGQGTGSLRSVFGNGTIVWGGCRVPGDYSTCSVPEFNGTLQLDGAGAIRR
jgi:hypothetical protein